MRRGQRRCADVACPLIAPCGSCLRWRSCGTGRSHRWQSSSNLPCPTPLGIGRWRQAHWCRRVRGWAQIQWNGYFFGLEMYAVDGTTLRVADSDANRGHFGGQDAGEVHGTSGYPLMRVVVLMAVRSHLLTAASFGPYNIDERTYARALWGSVPDHSLVLVDRNYLQADVLIPMMSGGTQRHWMTRAKSNTVFRQIRKLGSGDDLVEMEVSGEARKKNLALPTHWMCSPLPTKRVSAANPADLAPRRETLPSRRDSHPLSRALGDRAWLRRDQDRHARALRDNSQQEPTGCRAGDVGHPHCLQPGSARDRAHRRRAGCPADPNQLCRGASVFRRAVAVGCDDLHSWRDSATPDHDARQNPALRLGPRRESAITGRYASIWVSPNRLADRRTRLGDRGSRLRWRRTRRS